MFSLKSFLSSKRIYLKLLFVFFSLITLIILYNEYKNINKAVVPLQIINKDIYKYSQKRIYITGSVKYPGYINIDDNSPRLLDAINKAGGLSKLSNINKIKLATSIEKANYIYLPFIFEDTDVIIVNDKNKKKIKHHKTHHKKKKKYKYKEERFILSTYNTIFKFDNSVSWLDSLINKSFSVDKIKNNLSKSLKNLHLKELRDNYYSNILEDMDSIIDEYKYSLIYYDTFDNEIDMYLYSKDLQGKKSSKVTNDKNKSIKKVIISKDLDKTNKINSDKNFSEISIVKINVNTASKHELIQIPGIGEKIADRIIEYRATKKISSKDDLLKIKGIGENKANKLINYLEF